MLISSRIILPTTGVVHKCSWTWNDIVITDSDQLTGSGFMDIKIWCRIFFLKMVFLNKYLN